ncbi:MAG: ankyrin repeat domain-containing protein, partial [Terriglobia bacterium]
PVGDLELLEAVRKGDKEAVRSLVGQRADVNAAQADGTTALAWAVHRDDLDMADLLIRAGANVNAENGLGVTPLSLACTNGSAAMVQKLATAGANPNLALRTGETPLLTCARTGNVEAVKSLLARGADVNAKEGRRGQTALMWAVAQKHAEVVRALIQGGADIRARSEGGFTPLLFAARVGDKDSAGALLEAGADVNEATPENGSAVVVASSSGHEALAIFLLEKGADPNATDANGVTPLHFAALRGLPTIGGLRYNTVVSYLFRPNMLELAKTLLARGANPNARMAKMNPEFSSDLAWIDPLGATPFLLATASNDLSLMRLLADNGADPSLTTKDSTTPLMVATGIGRTAERSEADEKAALETVKLAVELGADVNGADASGQTSLHAASYIGSDAIARFLVEKGAKVDATDSYGMTPLGIAEGITQGNLPRAKRIRRPHKSTADILRQVAGNTASR